MVENSKIINQALEIGLDPIFALELSGIGRLELGSVDGQPTFSVTVDRRKNGDRIRFSFQKGEVRIITAQNGQEELLAYTEGVDLNNIEVTPVGDLVYLLDPPSKFWVVGISRTGDFVITE